MSLPPIHPIRRPYCVRHYEGLGDGLMGDLNRVILHDTESHDARLGWSDCSAVVANWKGNPQPSTSHPGTSWYYGAHFVVNKRGYAVSVDTVHTLLNHCGGANTGSIGIEQIGFASFTHAQWLQRPAQLRKVAKFLAWAHHQYGIPLVLNTTRGVSTHAMQSKVNPASSGHTDPGTGYPLKEVIDMAQGFVNRGGWWY